MCMAQLVGLWCVNGRHMVESKMVYWRKPECVPGEVYPNGPCSIPHGGYMDNDISNIDECIWCRLNDNWHDQLPVREWDAENWQTLNGYWHRDGGHRTRGKTALEQDWRNS
ncbi:hypothetical protein ABKA04_004092 [Annulohypoxylon sp. FPYF3050]